MHHARSAGTSDKARIKINQKIISWADVIFVMERKHLDIIRQRFGFEDQTLVVLDIADDYQFADPRLVELLKIALAHYL
jgi:predicted protein tyrosine phosphatase